MGVGTAQFPFPSLPSIQRTVHRILPIELRYGAMDENDHATLIAHKTNMAVLPQQQEGLLVDHSTGGDLEEAKLLGAGAVLTFTQVHFLVNHLQEYKRLETKRGHFLIYMFLLLVYIGLNVALLIANFQDQEVIESEYYIPFHMSGFWGLFGFTIVEGMILIATDFVSWNNWLQSMILLFNVVMTFACAMVFTIDPEIYEVPAHFMEYSAQVLVSVVSVTFLNDSLRFTSLGGASRSRLLPYAEGLVMIIVLAASLFQLSLYAGRPEVPMGPERSAHFCEFAIEIFNGTFALAYAMMAHRNVGQSMEQHYLALQSPIGSSKAIVA